MADNLIQVLEGLRGPYDVQESVGTLAETIPAPVAQPARGGPFMKLSKPIILGAALIASAFILSRRTRGGAHAVDGLGATLRPVRVKRSGRNRRWRTLGYRLTYTKTEAKELAAGDRALDLCRSRGLRPRTPSFIRCYKSEMKAWRKRTRIGARRRRK